MSVDGERREDLRIRREKIDIYGPWRWQRDPRHFPCHSRGRSISISRCSARLCHTPPTLHSMSPSTPGDSPIWSLFQTVLGVSAPRRRRRPLLFSPCSFPQSIVQVTLVCISGYVLARRGILDKATQKVVTFISHYVLPHRLTCSLIHSN